MKTIQPTGATVMTISNIEDFTAKIVRDVSGCWNWNGVITTRGYGSYWLNGRYAQAHRIVMELIHGIAHGAVTDHLCRNTICCNPAHLEYTTQKVNVHRGGSFASKNILKSHCPKGHEYTPENTYIRPGGTWRDCKTCIKINGAKRDRRRK
jgi:hypothetical protein